MARLGGGDEVSAKIKTEYEGKGIKDTDQGLHELENTSRFTSANIEGHWNALKSKWLEIVATVYTLKKAWDSAFAAAQFQQQEQAFANLAGSHGQNAQSMIVELRRLSAQTISTADLMQSAGTAMLLGIPADRLARMMEIARAASRITGQSVQAAFNDIAKGVGRQSKLILDNLGIMVDVGKANKEYAKSMGIVGRALTDVEAKQAFLNAVMASGEDTIRRVGVTAMTSAEAMQAYLATIQNAGIWVGKAIISVSTFAATATQLAGATVAAILGQTAKFVGRFMETLSGLPFIGENFDEMSLALKEFAHFEFEAMEEAIFLADSLWTVNRALFKQAEAIGAVTKAKKEQEEFSPKTGLAAFTREEEIKAFEFHEFMADQQAAQDAARWKKRLTTEANFQSQIMTLKFNAANQAVALLHIVGQKSEALAVAALIFQKGLAMAQVFISTQTAAAAALAPPPLGLGPVLGMPLASTIRAMGEWSMGLIAATGIAEAAFGGGGPSGVGGGGGVGSIPIVSPVPERVEQPRERPQIVFQVENMQLLDEDSVDRLAARLSDRVENYDVKLVATKATG